MYEVYVCTACRLDWSSAFLCGSTTNTFAKQPCREAERPVCSDRSFSQASSSVTETERQPVICVRDVRLCVYMYMCVYACGIMLTRFSEPRLPGHKL